MASSLLQEITAGSSVNLECMSVPMHVPINYCRFVLPDGTGFSINENTTIDKYVYESKSQALSLERVERFRIPHVALVFYTGRSNFSIKI